jgi:hypothetical protein
MGAGISNSEILETLTKLNAALSRPVWLFGGVAVDFLVGRWTRPHGDIDVCTYGDYRGQLTQELNAIGFHTDNIGWITHWACGEAAWRLEMVFFERGPEYSGVLVIRPKEAVGVPGCYPTLAGYLDPDRRATLDGVTFRVCSPAGEWLARAPGLEVVEGRRPDPKIEHDRLLLEGLLPAAERAELRDVASQRARVAQSISRPNSPPT